VRGVLPQILGSGNQFDEDAIVGGSCVLLNTMNDLAAATVVEVSGGSASVEYHRLGRFTAVSNSEGFFRFPPIDRVSRVKPEANDGARIVTVDSFSQNYGATENTIDFVFTSIAIFHLPF